MDSGCVEGKKEGGMIGKEGEIGRCLSKGFCFERVAKKDNR